MKKILFIAHDDLGGGAGRALYEQVVCMLSSGTFQPIVITKGRNNLTESLERLGVETYSLYYDFTSVWNTIKLFMVIKRFFYRSFFNFFSYRKLKRKVELSKISLVVSNSSVVDFGAYLYKKTGIPHVWFLREFGDDLVPLVKKLGMYISNNSTKIIAVSKAVAQRWIEKGVDKEKVNVVYDGVPKLMNFDIDGKNCDGVIKMCMCGRISKFKGQWFAVSALALLPKYIQERFRLDFFGNGFNISCLKRIVKKNCLENIVTFKGFSQNLNYELYGYNVGLNLTQEEGFGRTTVEYMQHGLFVVGCKSGATPEILENGKYGALVDYGDVFALSKIFMSMVDGNVDFENTGKSAKEFAEKNFVIEDNYFEIEKIYDAVVS